MQAQVDLTICQGHGVCNMRAPQIFELDDDGYSIVIVDPIPGELEADTQLAADSCPEGAITVVHVDD